MKESVSKLEAWFLKHQRPLPWRKTQDPYRIWVSEIMLQQTQVAAVIPYYERFLEAFPTLEDLAKAKEEKVLSLWSGLGYYSRARNLQKGAKYLLDNFGGKFPKSREEVLKVPGIGPYTAGAILSIAFDLPVELVDGNVYRVFARYFGFKKSIDLPKHQKFFWEMAKESVGFAKSPRVFNQALMELGATVCTKASPMCDHCPLKKSCAAFKLNLQEKLPIRKERRKTVELKWDIAVYENKGKVFLVQNKKEDWWSGMWDFPRGKKIKGTPLSLQTHTVTHHRIQASPVLVKSKKPKIQGKWFLKEDALRSPISSLCRKILISLS